MVPRMQGLVAAEPCAERRAGLGRRGIPRSDHSDHSEWACPERRNGPRCRGPFARQGRNAARYGSRLPCSERTHVVTVGSQSGSTIPRSASAASCAAGSIAVRSAEAGPSSPALSAHAASDHAASLQAASLQAAEAQAADAHAASDQAAEAHAASDHAASDHAASLQAASDHAASLRAASPRPPR